MLLPYNVDRPARRTPAVTYALIAANVLVYLLTIGYSNWKMYDDRPHLEEQITQISQLLKKFGQDDGKFLSDINSSNESSVPSTKSAAQPWLLKAPQKMQEGAPAGVGAPDTGSPAAGMPDASALAQKAEAQAVAAQDQFDAELKKIIPAGTERSFAWNLEHRKDVITFDINSDVEGLLAYVPASPSLLTFFSAMFLHANLEHILGNMLFLWVFGRAVEDTLGPKFYLSAYLLCGAAATLLFHIMTQTFAPASMAMPSLGASGAIAGVQGLFAPRFYRTPVRVFYLNFLGIRFFYTIMPILGGIFAHSLGLGASGFTFATLLVLAGIVLWGNDMLWGEWKVAAAWLIGGWLTIFDVIPMLIEAFMHRQGGVAHWAHIGGLLCGVAYAFLIGAHREGKSEYLVDEARQSLDMRLAGNALESARQVVMMRPEDPVGYQLLAESYDRKDNREEALKNYKLALDKYLRQGERSAASKLYQDAIAKHSEWVPDAPTLFTLASQMAKDDNWKGAAENLAKLPYFYPEASEGEMAFLRAAQIYLDKLDQPLVSMQLLHEFGARFPDSQWMPKATAMYEAANQKHSGAPMK